MTTLASPTLSSFAITPISAAFVTRVRTTLRDDFGRAVAVTTAAGGEPMRDQLRRAAPGERLILCSYQAVALPSPFAEIGPVYVSADAPAPAPFRSELPSGYFNRIFALRAYDRFDRIVDSTLVEPVAAAAKFAEFLARDDVAYLHARFAGHGCFAARIERS
ncbi:MAG: DUF1203 domain-containing protein [Candidatus Didemnitutus sp.]|nr:DUF1203 domain-containing protein [Candidatus Didemnitutus sp.]